MLKLVYATFDREPPSRLDGPRGFVIHAVCALFFVVAAGATVALNLLSIPLAGTVITFLGQPKVNYRFLRLFGQVPVILANGTALAIFGIWRRPEGVWWTVGVVFALWLVGIVLLGVAAWWNRVAADRGRAPAPRGPIEG